MSSSLIHVHIHDKHKLTIKQAKFDLPQKGDELRCCLLEALLTVQSSKLVYEYMTRSQD